MHSLHCFLKFLFLGDFFSFVQREKVAKEKSQKKKKRSVHLNHFLNFGPLFLKGFSGMMAVETEGEEKCIAFWSVTTSGTSWAR